MRVFILLLIFSLNISSNPISITDSIFPKSVLSESEFICDFEKKAIEDILNNKNLLWEKNSKNLNSFGFETCNIWIKLEIKNFTEDEDFYLISEYAWIDEVEIFLFQNSKLLYHEKNGDSVPFNQKKLKYKIPAFLLKLHKDQNYFIYIKINSYSEKLVELKLENKNSFLTRSQVTRDFFPAFFFVSMIVIFINFLIYKKIKSNICILYNFMLFELILYASIFNGAFYEYIMPDTSFEKDKLLYSGAFVFITFYFQFWKRFLLLKLYIPFLDKLYNIVSGISIFFLSLFLFEIISHEFLEISARIVLFFAIISSIYSAIKVYSKNFKPAIYSVYGLPIAFSFSLFHYMSGIGELSGNEFTKNCIYYGFLIEFLVFFFSISSRFEFMQNELNKDGQSLSNIENDFILKVKKSRTQNLDSEFYINKLKNLMETEKLFCDEDISLNRLSEILNIRADQLSEIINNKFQKNFNQYINDFRIEEAKNLLIKDKKRNILNIAFACGFNSKSTFNSEFKKRTGLTPKKFKEISSES